MPLDGSQRGIWFPTFSRCSWYCGRLANISFMSFKFAAPSLYTTPKFLGEYVLRSRRRDMNLPLEARVLTYELIKVRHELVNSLSHVHMPHFRPHGIRIRKGCGLVFIGADRGLEFISMPRRRPASELRDRWPRKDCKGGGEWQLGKSGRTYTSSRRV